MIDRDLERSWPRRGIMLAALGMAVWVFLTFLPSLDNEFIYDDNTIILEHGGVHDFAAVNTIFQEPHFPYAPYYRPVTRTTLLLQKGWHGNEPFPFHVFNALLMAVTAVAVFALLRLPALRIKTPVAAVLAAAFALHPVASSCVYPICSGRETLLPALLMILALYWHLQSGLWPRIFAFALFAVALFCKEQAVVMPAVFIVADLLGLREQRSGPRWRWLAAYVPYAVAGGLYLWLRHALFGSQEYEFAVLEEPLGPIKSLLYAIQSLLVPFAELAYEPAFSVWWSGWRLLVAAVLLGVLAILLRRQSKPGRLVLFWTGWFVLLQLPTANVIEQEAPYAERYVFLGGLGLFAIAGFALSAFSWRRRAGFALLGTSVLLLAALSAVSWQRAQYFETDRAFAEQWLKTNPRAAEAHGLLGWVLNREGNEAGAIEHYRLALQDDPRFVNVHVNLGKLYHEQSRWDAARDHLQQALKLRPTQADAHEILGQVYRDLNRFEEAIQHFETAIAHDPKRPGTYNNLGICLCETGRLAEAVLAFETAVRQDPELAIAYSNLGTTYALLNEPDLAREALQKAVALAPTEVRYRRLLVERLMAEERWEKAREVALDTVKVRPKFALMVALLGEIERALGDEAAAESRYLEALSMNPELVVAEANLIWLYATASSASMRDGEQALRRWQSLAQDPRAPAILGQSRFLDLGAAVAAGAGDFERATSLVQQAIQHAEQAGRDAAELRTRLAHYQRKQLYRE